MSDDRSRSSATGSFRALIYTHVPTEGFLSAATAMSARIPWMNCAGSNTASGSDTAAEMYLPTRQQNRSAARSGAGRLRVVRRGWLSRSARSRPASAPTYSCSTPRTHRSPAVGSDPRQFISLRERRDPDAGRRELGGSEGTIREVDSGDNYRAPSRIRLRKRPASQRLCCSGCVIGSLARLRRRLSDLPAGKQRAGA